MKNQKSNKILCSGGKGEVEKSACLQCALSKKNNCGYDYALLKALFSDKEREGVHVTDLTGCLRRAYYDKTLQPIEYVHSMLARFVGTAVHSAVEGNDENMMSEVDVDGYGIVGRVDIVYGNGTLMDVKTTRWLSPSKLPYGSHVAQLNIYAALLKSKGVSVNRLAIQYIDMSGPSKCRSCRVVVVPDENGIPVCPKCENHPRDAHFGAMVFEVPIEDSEMVADEVILRRKALELSVEAGQLPEKEESYLCDYCPFQSVCQEAG